MEDALVLQKQDAERKQEYATALLEQIREKEIVKHSFKTRTLPLDPCVQQSGCISQRAPGDSLRSSESIWNSQNRFPEQGMSACTTSHHPVPGYWVPMARPHANAPYSMSQSFPGVEPNDMKGGFFYPQTMNWNQGNHGGMSLREFVGHTRLMQLLQFCFLESGILENHVRPNRYGSTRAGRMQFKSGT